MTTQSELVDAYAETGRYHRPWYWYDWANSAFVTTVGTVLFGPYLTTVAKEAACPGISSDDKCTTPLYVVPGRRGPAGLGPGARLRRGGGPARSPSCSASWPTPAAATSRCGPRPW